jgi:hypothetical protein
MEPGSGTAPLLYGPTIVLYNGAWGEAETGAGAGAGAGAIRLGLLWAPVAFCRAILARVSIILGMAEGGGGGGWLCCGPADLFPAPPRNAIELGGGLPGGVVDASISTDTAVRASKLPTPLPGPCGDPARSRIARVKPTSFGAVELRFEGLDHGSRERLTLVPDVDEFSNPILQVKYPCECLFPSLVAGRMGVDADAGANV